MPLYIIGAFILLITLVIGLIIVRHSLLHELKVAYWVLGYYKFRFGDVSIEDIADGVGLPKEITDKIK